MLLNDYTLEIVRPECNPSFESVHCIAHLGQDISEALPYVNAELGGFAYIVDPPSVTFKVHGKLITLHAKKIAVNALKDQEEAERVLSWLQTEINRCWENRQNITPSTQGHAGPQIIEILKFLPKTNCKECGQPTCMMFASLVSERAKRPTDCPPLEIKQRNQLEAYLGKFPEPNYLPEEES